MNSFLFIHIIKAHIIILVSFFIIIITLYKNKKNFSNGNERNYYFIYIKIECELTFKK